MKIGEDRDDARRSVRRTWSARHRRWNEYAAKSLGIPFPPVAERFDWLEDTLRLCLVAKYADACNLFPTPELQHKLDVLKRHCEQERRNYDDIEKTTLFGFDVGDRGENVGAIVERLRGLARMGFATAIGGVRDVHKITPFEIMAREIIPAAAAF